MCNYCCSAFVAAGGKTKATVGMVQSVEKTWVCGEWKRKEKAAIRPRQATRVAR